MLAAADRRLAAVLVALASLAPAAAHRGALTRGSCGADFGSSSAALQISDPTISWAFKHYVDCTRRAVWMRFTNPGANFKFYVGVGVPPVARFAALRADAVIIGPGLPQLSAGDLASVPDEVRNDPAWTSDMGALLHRSPADQSTCDHLGTVMRGASTVRNGRCDFYEPYGRTNSWRVLDADRNNIPVSDGTYYVAVWLQASTSGKMGIAFGTWKENFWSQQTIHVPTCTRNMADFSEKQGEQASDFPVLACSSGSNGPSPGGGGVDQGACALGELCGCPTCRACSRSYTVSMGCGGQHCPAAAQLWDKANMKMHKGMAINFTGDVGLDFVRGMIPHHQGAVDMCSVLVLNLTCKTWEDSGALDGLVHFCNHVNQEQQRELAGMRSWLDAKNVQENASCMGSSTMNGLGHHAHHMPDGCGEVMTASSMYFIDANRKMHAGMAINFSCSHDVDFVRGMIPHHAGAVAMCQILNRHSGASPDAYLSDLCANITRLQRAEIAWMSKWLKARGHSAIAPCEDCGAAARPPEPAMPCEDLLPATSFCHRLGGDFFCKCESAVQQHTCGTLDEIEGFAVLNMSAECQRTCGLCPTQRPPLFHNLSCAKGMKHSGNMTSHGGSGYMTSRGSISVKWRFTVFLSVAMHFAAWH